MSTDDVTPIDRLAITQKLTFMVNRYEVHQLAADGSLGGLIAVAQQKRLAFKEQVTFFADEDRRTPVFSFKARTTLDFGASYDVVDAHGTPLGMFRKEFAQSLLRSTWHLEGAGFQAVGQERNYTIALLRRLWQFVPFVGELPLPFLFHFDFTTTSGEVVLSSERRRSLRDRYDVTIPGSHIDWRVAAAMAVALDALQSR